MKPILENDTRPVRIFSFDESRFGLFTVKRKRITLKGIKPVGKMQTEYKSYWLYGAFDVLSGESFYWEFNKMTKLNYHHFITDLSKTYPDTLNIILMDNSKTHDKKIEFDNIKFINTEPYSPELNPAERVWHFIKDTLNWQVFDDIPKLQDFVNDKINNISKQQILSLISFKYIIHAYYALIHI